MRKIFSKVGLAKLFFTLVGFVWSSVAVSQQLPIQGFSVFGVNNVELRNGAKITNGRVGSNSLVNSTGTVEFGSSIHSGGRILLSNANTVNGNLTIANSASVSGNVFSAGTSSVLNGNIYVAGNSSVTSGSISGFLHHPSGTTHTGVSPAGGFIIGNPPLPTLPGLPPVSVFPAAGTANISSTQTVQPLPSTYGNVSLNGNKTLTFAGPGTYVFNTITNNTNNNKFKFDFQNSPTGIIRVYVHGDVDLDKIEMQLVNGGSASRIFMEVHGNGSSNANGIAWRIANAASGNNQSIWYGTVYAPYGGINVGTQSGPSKIFGALWSGTKVIVEDGVTVTHYAFEGCASPTVNAGPDVSIDCDHPSGQLNGSVSNPALPFSWSVVNGNFTSNSLTPTVTAGGIYVLKVTDPCGTVVTDTAIVNFTPCILPYYPPTGKVFTKIGSELTSLFKTDSATGNVSDTNQVVYLLNGDSVLIDIISYAGQTAALKTLLQTPAYGLGTTISNGPNSLIITGWFPVDNLKKLNEVAAVNYCRPAFPAISNTGLIRSQGDSSIKAGLARNGYNLAGDGIKVGVLSDSYNTLPNNPASFDVQNGDLPGAGNPLNSNEVEVLQEYPFGRRTDEGRAMLQIIHDVAPKSKLAFRTGFLTPGDMAVGIRELVDNLNCDVLVDDVTFITEPFFKAGVIEDSVSSVVNKDSVVYVTAAGNFGAKSYTSVFRPVAPPAGLTGRAHNFNLSGNDIFQNDSLYGTVLKPGIYTIVLQWDNHVYSKDGADSTVDDFDIYLTDDNGVTLFGFNRNNRGGDPIEVLPFTVTDTTATNILIVNASASSSLTTSDILFKYIVFRGDIKINEYNTGNSTVVGQANSLDAITVGASLYSNTPPYAVNPPTIASFSSRGGTPVNNVVRNKPDLVGPNGVNTSVNLGSVDYENDGRPNFFGTSAAAPHIAGGVALMMQAKIRYYSQPLGPVDAKSLLTSSATNMDAAGFDFTTGYGLADIDSAMRAMGNPTPQLLKLELEDSSLAPGAQPMNLILHGNYFMPQTKVLFGNDTLPTTIQSSTIAIALLPAFENEKLVSAYTAPKSLTALDGGQSASISITGVVKKLVEVIANDASKKYGEVLPDFSVTIKVDGDSLQNTTFTAADLGLANITYQTNGNAFSNTGIPYFIRPVRTFDPNVPADAALLAQYNYVFTNGLLQVQKLPITVTPRDTSFVYGEAIGDIQFDYTYDPSINIANPALLLDTIHLTHQSLLNNSVIGLVNGQAVTIVNGQAIPIVNGQAVTIVNGQAVTIVNGQAVPIVNGQAITIVNGQAVTIVNNLSTSDVNNMSFMMSEESIENARPVVNTRIVNGVPVTTTMHVVDVTQESILDFNANPVQTELLTSVSQTHTRGIVSASALINGQAVTIVNGQAITIVNGQAVTIVNGQAVTIVNGQAIPIVNSLNSTSNKTAVVVDQDDLLPAGVNHLRSINMITGLTSGQQMIIPGALLNDNLEVTYVPRTITISPAPITVKAKDSSKVYGQAITLDPARFTISSGTMQFAESIASVTLNSTGAGASGAAGSHPIIPSAAVAGAGTNLSNYAITYSNGTLTVGKASLLVKANDASRTYGAANPTFTATYSGFVNGETLATSGVTGSPALTSTAVATSLVGTYPINAAQGSLSSNNYAFGFAGGTLTVGKAPLTVKANDQVIFQGDPLPTLTGTITGLKNGDVATYSYAAPSYTGSAGMYPIIPTQVSFAKAAQYNITLVNGTLYVNPKGPGAKKLRPYLDCVEEVLNPPSLSRKYVAHFFCENTNATVVYVPVGADNKLTSNGSYDGSAQPVIFNPGTTRFDVPFDGVKLTWELRTFETNKKTSVASEASANSSRCSFNYTTSARGVTTSVVQTVSNEPAVYPNPTKGTVTIKGIALAGEKGVLLFDATGRKFAAKVIRTVAGQSVEVDLSLLKNGIYFLQFNTIDGRTTVRIVKN